MRAEGRSSKSGCTSKSDQSLGSPNTDACQRKRPLGDALIDGSERLKQDGNPDNGKPARFRAGGIVCIDPEATQDKHPTKYKVFDTEVQDGVRLYALELQTSERGVTTYKVVVADIVLPCPRFEIGAMLRVSMSVNHASYGAVGQIKRLNYDNHDSGWQYWTICMTSGSSSGPWSESFLGRVCY